MYEVKLEENLLKFFKQIEIEIEEGNRMNEREYKLLKKGIEKLSSDYRSGAQISRKHPVFSFYYKKYNVKNLWKLDVSKNWRLIYTVVGTEVKVLSIILELLDHKDYDRRFGYHTT